MWLNSQGSKTFRVLYVGPEGREYWFTMASVPGADGFAKDPPFVVYEREDFLEDPNGFRYSSLDDFATMHCCLRGELVSVDPGN